MGRYDGPEWLQSATDAIRSIDGVSAVEHDSGKDYQVYVSDASSKDSVMDAVENIYDKSYWITVSPTRNDDWFFVAIRESS